MAKHCEKYLEGLLALASGGHDDGAAAHASECDGCAEAVEQYRKMFAMASAGIADAPAASIEAVKRLLPGPIPVMRLTASSLQWAGARAAVADSFQLMFEEGGFKVRLMYVRRGSGWEVVGSVDPSADARVSSPASDLKMDEDGRFAFEAKSLSETQLRISGPGFELLVPAADEVSNGADGAR